jgi:endothelin-converting enzyme/putative endopeptidase
MEAFGGIGFGANVGADAKNSNRNVISVGPEL